VVRRSTPCLSRRICNLAASRSLNEALLDRIHWAVSPCCTVRRGWPPEGSRKIRTHLLFRPRFHRQIGDFLQLTASRSARRLDRKSPDHRNDVAGKFGGIGGCRQVAFRKRLFESTTDG